ncbi:MAG: TetR/AcrR family transcriptional regulator [Mesorhizobium sp.]|nr:MAG: TetR/AcrR family transcriptional regulator [Mesorhizobium sp.]TJW31281.1 MAG: TetR/AcrR family transcriptional regulator [Mesorhizobium sp.]
MLGRKKRRVTSATTDIHDPLPGAKSSRLDDDPCRRQQLGCNALISPEAPIRRRGLHVLLLFDNETIVTLRSLRYSVNMGRPKEHDIGTGEALLDAAEQIVENDGMTGLSVRRVADLAGTTTRAVYAVFGSKEGLIVALGRRTFNLLAHAMDELPTSNDPASDLVEAGVRVFRTLVVNHPALFKIGLQQRDVPPQLVQQFSAEAENAWFRLGSRFQRLAEQHLLGDQTIHDAAVQFHALCEGLAAVDLRGLLPGGREERLWREALGALIRGFRPTSIERSASHEGSVQSADPAASPNTDRARWSSPAAARSVMARK